MPIDEVNGDGGAGLMTQPTLDELKAEIDQIVKDYDTLAKTRVDIDDIRFARWDHQSADGLKHAEANSDEPVEPFEGASDMQVRVADMIIQEKVMLLVIAAVRAQINFRATEASDAKKAGAATIVMRWLLNNHLGVTWVRELIKLANYYTADSPALALCKVWWRQETALKMQTLTADELMELYLKQVVEVLAEAQGATTDAGGQTPESGGPSPQPSPEGEGMSGPASPEAIPGGEAPSPDIQAQAMQAAEDFKVALASKEFGEGILAEKLAEYFPGIRPARAKKVIKELREKGKAEFPVSYIRFNGPAVRALRFFEDWCAPANTTDFQEARVYFENEWLSKTQIIERKISEGWSDEFVEAVIGKVGNDGKREGGHEGTAAIPDYVRNDAGVTVKRGVEDYRGLYNILTAHYQATNEDGVPGRYYVTIHKDANVAATERKLLDYAHGLYAGHVFSREALNSRMVDTRGIGELAGSYQGLLKLYCDSFGDHAALAGVPPIITRGRQRMGTLHIKPLAELPAKRDGDYAWLTPPPYPQTVINMIRELRRQIDEYFGRTNEDVAPDLVRLQQEFAVLWWLINLREVLKQMWSLCQQYMPDEMLARITNQRGEAVIRSREEIQGSFDLDLQFNPQDLDPEYLKTISGIVKDLLMPMDRNKTIDPTPVVASILWRLSPDLAGASLKNVDQANQDEIKDEVRAYTEIRGGTEPELLDDGSINYQLRLQLYQNMQQMNPDIFNDMAPDKQKILQSRLQRMGVLAQQYGENVEIGRQGGKAALPAG